MNTVARFISSNSNRVWRRARAVVALLGGPVGGPLGGPLGLLLAVMATPVLAVPAPTIADAAPVAARAEDGVVERWYTVDLLGQKSGYSVTRTTTTSDRIATETTMSLSIKRGPISMSIRMETTFTETPDGKPVSMKSLQEIGTAPVVTEYTFGADGVEVVTGRGEGRKSAKEPLPKGDWLTPAAAERFSKQRYKSGAKEIVVRTVDPSLGLRVISTKRSGFTPTKVKVDGREIEALRTSIEQDVMPGVTSSEFLDAEGELIRSDTTVGGMAVVMTAATREEAMKAGAAPELMVSTFVKPDRPIPHARESARATLVLSVPEGDMPALPDTGAQRVEPTKTADGTGVRLTIAMARDALAPAPDADTTAEGLTLYLAATPMLDAADPLIAKLTRQALQGVGPDKAARAEALRRFVHRYISEKSLDVGLGSATDTARSKQGDCTEHAVLLAAMLRADGIPARVASGLIYADQFAGGRDVFAYHMWSQALLDVGGSKRWADVDATLGDARPSDATHVALVTSPLRAGEEMTSMVSVATVLGRLRIRVESVE